MTETVKEAPQLTAAGLRPVLLVLRLARLGGDPRGFLALRLLFLFNEGEARLVAYGYVKLGQSGAKGIGYVTEERATLDFELRCRGGEAPGPVFAEVAGEGPLDFL